MIYCNFTCIRCKVICRVFCSNTALDCIALWFNIILRFDINFRRIQTIAFCHQNLSLNQVNAGCHFGNGMLNLNSWIHFDKVMVAVLVYQELKRTCITIINSFCKFNCIVANCSTLFLCQCNGRSEFNNFLVTSLNGTVTFI